jgi:hypothetical protein
LGSIVNINPLWLATALYTQPAQVTICPALQLQMPKVSDDTLQSAGGGWKRLRFRCTGTGLVADMIIGSMSSPANLPGPAASVDPDL